MEAASPVGSGESGDVVVAAPCRHYRSGPAVCVHATPGRSMGKRAWSTGPASTLGHFSGVPGHKGRPRGDECFLGRGGAWNPRAPAGGGAWERGARKHCSRSAARLHFCTRLCCHPVLPIACPGAGGRGLGLARPHDISRAISAVLVACLHHWSQGGGIGELGRRRKGADPGVTSGHCRRRGPPPARSRPAKDRLPRRHSSGPPDGGADRSPGRGGALPSPLPGGRRPCRRCGGRRAGALRRG